MDVSLNQWLKRVPSEMLKAHLTIDKATAVKIPEAAWVLGGAFQDQRCSGPTSP
jgi:hypothetical protein